MSVLTKDRIALRTVIICTVQYILPNMTFVLLHRTLQSWQRPESACINNCNCYTASVSPVCGSNGVTYLSACFAGCTKPVSEKVN